MDFTKMKENISTYVTKETIMYFGICILFIGVALFIYFNTIKPQMENVYKANKEFIKDGQSDEATLYLFSVDWCPYCKKAKPIWDNLKNEVGDNVNGVPVVFVEVDCEKEKELANKYKIEGYPTIKLIYNGQIIEYDAKPDVSTLKEFLNTSIQ